MMPHWNVKRLANGLGDHAAAWSALNRRLFNTKPLLDFGLVDGLLNVQVFRHMHDLPADVQQLFAKAEHDNIEFGLSWYQNLVNFVYPNNDGLRLYVLRKKGRPVAALPVITRTTPLGQCIESLSNYYTSTYTLFIEPEVTVQDLVALVTAVRDAHSGLGSLQFAPMDPDSTVYHALPSALQTVGLPSFRFFCFGNWYLPVTSDWPTYLKNREGKLRNTIKRMGNSFSAAGGTLELVRDGVRLDAGIEAYVRVYAASWKQAEPYPNFVPGLVRTCAQRGWLRLGIAWLNGDPIAAQIWIVANNKANIYKLAYDEKHKAYAPGTLLTAMLMQHVFENDRVTEIDYLIGDDPYKKSWMSHRRERWGLVAYNPKSISGLFGLAREVLGRTLKPSIGRLRALMRTPKTTNEAALARTEINLNWNFFPATAFVSISEQWQLLCKRSLHSPLLSADFIEVALRHFGLGDELICFAENATGPVAATILQRKNRLVWETFQPSQMPMGPWLQLQPSDFPTILQSLLRALPAPAMMLGVTELDSQFWPRPTGESLLTIDSITTGEIDLPDSPEEFVKSFSSKPFDRRLRKAEKEIGPITLFTQTAPDVVDAYVNLYASMESRGWKGASGTALAPDNAQSKFYADLLRRFAATGRTRMFTLKMGDRNAAAQMALVENGTLYLLKTTDEPELQSLGPGVMLQYFISLYCYQQKQQIKHIEFYGPLNASQKMWVTGSRRIYQVNTYRSSLLAKAHRHLMDRRTRREQARLTEVTLPI